MGVVRRRVRIGCCDASSRVRPSGWLKGRPLGITNWREAERRMAQWRLRSYICAKGTPDSHAPMPQPSGRSLGCLVPCPERRCARGCFFWDDVAFSAGMTLSGGSHGYRHWTARVALAAAGSLEEAQHWLKEDVRIAKRIAGADQGNPLPRSCLE